MWLEIAQIVTGYAVVLGALPLGVAAGRHRFITGRWPGGQVQWRRNATILAAGIQSGGKRYAREFGASLRGDVADGELWRRVVSFVLSFGLLVRACIHVAIHAYVYPDANPPVDHELVWRPVPIPDAGVALIARGFSVLVGWQLAWTVWEYRFIAEPWWVGPVARWFLYAQAAVLLADALAGVADLLRPLPATADAFDTDDRPLVTTIPN